MMEKGENSLPTIFDFSIIVVATNNFSNRNKLGEGGFGTVHKVKWSNLFLVTKLFILIVKYQIFPK